MTGIYGSGCIVPGEYRGMQWNAGERQGNVWYCVQSARGIQGNPRGTYGNGCSVRGMLGYTGEFEGNIWEWV